MNILYNLSYIFMYFFVASIIGYVCEVVNCSLKENSFVWNRGFLLGPYIPIYGVGTIIILYFLQSYYDRPAILFLLTVIICSVLEYVTSWVMEKLFKVRWWDYSNEDFNIGGRICLVNSFLFGMAGLIVVYIVNPLITFVFSLIPHFIMILIGSICALVFLTDLIVTLVTLVSIRMTLRDIEKTKNEDSTADTHEKVIKRIRKNSFLYGILLKAFPYIDGVNQDSLKELRNLVDKIRKTIDMGEKVVNHTKKVVDNTKDMMTTRTENTFKKIELKKIK